jgi:large subunit ribosomal protein L10
VALNLQDKQSIVAEVSEVAGKAFSAVVAEYAGMSAVQMTELRAKARNEGVYVRVVKNTLARRAVEGTEFACMQEVLVGPLVVAFSQEDPGGAGRVISDFAKANEKLVVKAVSIGGKLLPATELARLARIPSKPQAISQLMAVMKAPVGKLAATLAAVRDQKGGAEAA